MKVVESVKELRNQLFSVRSKGKSLALVPTMGALHAGHLSLVETAKSASDLVAISIFVNPLQFNNKEDLKKYPSTIKKDLELAEESGVNLVFAPPLEEIYPNQVTTSVKAGSMSEGLCGQQLKVIEQLNQDLHFGLQIVPSPLIREENGLALSSRNSRLSPEQKEQASQLYKSLDKTKHLFISGEKDLRKLEETFTTALKDSNLKLEYFEALEESTLEKKEPISSNHRLFAAVEINGIRLIDNLSLSLK